jgi:hypothetical protein
MKRSAIGTNPEIGDVSLDAAARGSKLDGCIPYRQFLTNDSTEHELDYTASGQAKSQTFHRMSNGAIRDGTSNLCEMRLSSRGTGASSPRLPFGITPVMVTNFQSRHDERIYHAQHTVAYFPPTRKISFVTNVRYVGMSHKFGYTKFDLAMAQRIIW